MTTTPTPNAIDLTKPTNVGESACQLLIVPHVPSFNAVRQIVCETSTVLVNQTNLIRVVKNRCTQHLNLSVDQLLVKQKMLEITMHAHALHEHLTADSDRETGENRVAGLD